MATEIQVRARPLENRDRTTPMSGRLRGEIDESSTAWTMRQNHGIEPVGTRAIGELVPPGYLDTPCARCGHLPGVEVLSNGNMVSPISCEHMHCTGCGFLPPELQGNCCIFQDYLTAAPILNATRPQIFLQQTPVSAENLAFLQRHRIPNMWRGENPVPEFWRDLRIAYDQRRACTRTNDPRRRQNFEEEITREGLDPKLCRRRIVELRLLQRREAERGRVNRYMNRMTRFIDNLPRVSYGKLTEGQECAICLVEYAIKEPQEAGPHVPVRLPCGHVFGADCLANWLKDSMGNGCPMCRAVVMPVATGLSTRNHQSIQGAGNQQVNHGNQGTRNQQNIQGAGNQQVHQGGLDHQDIRGTGNQQANHSTQTTPVPGNIHAHQSRRAIQGAHVNQNTQVNQSIPTNRSAQNNQRNGG